MGGEATVTPHASVDAGRPIINSNGGNYSDHSRPATPTLEPTVSLGISFPNLPNLPNLSHLPNGATVATDLLDAADKHVPTLSVNARRKYFHALAVLMFLPGVAMDVSACSSPANGLPT